MEKLKVNFVLDHSQYFEPTTHYVGVGQSYQSALYDLKRLIYEADQSIELDDQLDDDYIVAYDVAIKNNELLLMQSTLVKANESLPVVKVNDDNEVHAIVACESDVRLLNISEALKAELIATIEYSEVAIFAELIEE